MMKFEALRKKILDLRLKCERNGEPMFMGIPDSWYEDPGPKFRCSGDHVTNFVVKSEVVGDYCSVCHEPVLMTFPGDKPGQLPDTTV
jgi:hypothetical protein